MRPAATEKTKRAEKLSPTALVNDSPPATAVFNSSYNEELMIKNSGKLPPETTACSRSKGVAEDYWNREMASMLHLLRESRQKEDGSVLERVTLLTETSVLSKSGLMRMLSELSDTEKSALTVTLVTAFCSNRQSCKEQQQRIGTGSARRERPHTEERLEHNTHMHRKLRFPAEV